MTTIYLLGGLNNRSPKFKTNLPILQAIQFNEKEVRRQLIAVKGNCQFRKEYLHVTLIGNNFCLSAIRQVFDKRRENSVTIKLSADLACSYKWDYVKHELTVEVKPKTVDVIFTLRNGQYWKQPLTIKGFSVQLDLSLEDKIVYSMLAKQQHKDSSTHEKFHLSRLTKKDQ